MREQGVRGLAVRCLNHACLHRNVISADNYPGEVEVPSFGLRMKCSKCDGRRVDVRPNWKEKASMPDSCQGVQLGRSDAPLGGH